MKQGLLFFILLLLFGSCERDGDPPVVVTNSLEVPVITGFYQRDFFGNIVREVGAPNIAPLEEHPFCGELVIYPNPVSQNGYFSIHIPCRVPTRLIIVQGDYVRDGINDRHVNNQVGATYRNVGGVSQFSLDLPPSALPQFTPSFNGLGPGYYRVYVQVGDQLYYDNLVITN